MPRPLYERILDYIKSPQYRPQRPRGLARELELHRDEQYPAFREALRDLMHEGRVVLGASGTIVLPTQRVAHDQLVGTYRHNRRGFGFVIPTAPGAHEDLFIPPGDNGGAMTGDQVRAKITSRGQRDGKALYTGRVLEILQRTNKRFVGSLSKQHGQWMVFPDGNALTEPILTPDAASRHIKPGTKVVVELTSYPAEGTLAQGVITEVLGAAGDKDVDLRGVIVQYNLPQEFPEAVLQQARNAVDRAKLEDQLRHRLDLTNEVVVTIDPDDAKDYDDAISLRKLDNGFWEVGVHIADVSHFVPTGSALDQEARERGNSAYFPGYVIPMLPEILSNGICSLQEGVLRLCKSAFITLDDDANPVATRFANSIIKSRRRLRYREAQAIIDNAAEVPHPEGARKVSDYPAEVVRLLHDMNALARRIQKRRLAAGQIVLNLPEVELVLDEGGKVVDAVPEDQSFTHTLIEMFMVEANEAVARLLDSLEVPFLRRTHPDPDLDDSERLRQFVTVAGYKLPKTLDRRAIQSLLHAVAGRPEAFAIHLAVLRSLTRAEYSPQAIGHYALASQHYCHFTSPIRRYADLMIHRLLDEYFRQNEGAGRGERSRGGRKRAHFAMNGVPSEKDLIELGKHLSFTERRADDAERELRQMKILSLLQKHIGEQFLGVITGITNFGIFVQIQPYLIDGLIRYEQLMDDWWDVDERGGTIRGQRTGTRIRIGDLAKVTVARIDLPRRELDLSIAQLLGKAGRPETPVKPKPEKKGKKGQRPQMAMRGGQSRRQYRGRRR